MDKTIYTNPVIMKLLEDYFDEMIELMPKEAGTKRFDVCSRSIPDGDCGTVGVDIQMGKNGKPFIALAYIS